MNYKLKASLAYRSHLLDRLREYFPEADEDTLLDTLEGISDLDEVISEIVRSRLDDLALVEALQRRRDEMHERLGRLKGRAEKKKELIVEALEASGLKKILREDFTLSLRPGTVGLQVLDEAVIPEAYWRAQPPKLDRLALVAALKQGAAIPGALLTNPAATIALRTK